MVRKLAGRVTSADGERGGLSGLGMMGNDVLHRMGAKNRAPKAPRGAERCPRCETSNRSESFETFQTTQALDSTQQSRNESAMLRCLHVALRFRQHAAIAPEVRNDAMRPDGLELAPS